MKAYPAGNPFMANIMPELLLRRCSRPLMKSFAAIEDSSVLWWGETVPQLPPPPPAAQPELWRRVKLAIEEPPGGVGRPP